MKAAYSPHIIRIKKKIVVLYSDYIAFNGPYEDEKGLCREQIHSLRHYAETITFIFQHISLQTTSDLKVELRH